MYEGDHTCQLLNLRVLSWCVRLVLLHARRYIKAVVEVSKAFLADKGDIDKFVLSYHGIPCKYHERSDPYPWHCEATTRAIVAGMGWEEGQFVQT